MLAVVICVAYIIGIIMGLYLDFYLSIALFLLLIGATLILNYFYKKQEYNLKKVIILSFLTCLIGFIHTTCKIHDLQYKYSERSFL